MPSSTKTPMRSMRAHRFANSDAESEQNESDSPDERSLRRRPASAIRKSEAINLDSDDDDASMPTPGTRSKGKRGMKRKREVSCTECDKPLRDDQRRYKSMAAHDKCGRLQAQALKLVAKKGMNAKQFKEFKN